MATTTPYFLFDDNCDEAMKFYKDCFGGDLTIVKVGDSPMKQKFPPEYSEKILHAQLKSGDMVLSASDWLLPDRPRKPGNTTCVYLSGATYEELVEYFEKLSKGADPKTLDALNAMPMVGTYGALTDKYGVRWMFQGEPKAN